ncbi:MAG TPA: hypothetical protein VGL61_04965 [Kofleriaceae bacterium]
MADLQQQQTGTTATATKAKPGQQALPKGVRALNYRLSTSHGHPSVSSVVQIVQRYPEDRDAIMEALHKKLGNGFVQQVVDAAQRAHAARGSRPDVTGAQEPEETHGAAPAAAQPSSIPAPAIAPAPANHAAPAPSAAPVSAAIASSPVSTATPAKTAELEQHGWWQTTKQATADAAQLIEEAHQLTTFHPLSGTFEGTVDLAAAVRLVQLVVPASMLPALTLGQAPSGTNQVFLQVNLYHRTALITAAQIHIAGFANAKLQTGACTLQGVQAHGTLHSVDVAVEHAHFDHVTFVRDGEHLGAAEMDVTNLRANGTHADGAMSFSGAHIHGLAYPNVPPVDLDIPGGASFDRVWAHAATPKKPAAAGGLPEVPAAADVLPQNSRIAIKLVGLQGGTSATAGQGGFEQLRAAIVQDGGHELASVEIDGFRGAGSVGPGAQVAGGASIRQLVVTGDPKLVDTLLKNPQVAGDPHVKAAIDLARSVGIDPSISGHLVAHDITATHGAAGDQARGDFDGSFDVPQLGLLDVKLKGMTASSTNGAAQVATQFESCALTLHDHQHKELAYLELDGGAAKIAGAERQGHVKQIAARGNVAQLVTAGDAIVKHMPVEVRGAMQAVHALGVTGSVTGSLAIDSDGKTTTFSGDFDAEVEAGDTGSIALHVAGLHGSDSGAVSFASFTASMKDAKGRQAASIDIEGGETASGKPGHDTATAKKISAKGEDASVSAMIAALQKKATTLPAPVKASFAMVRRFYANAGGSIAMTNAAVGTTTGGADTARASQIDASFELKGAGTAQVSLAGFHTTLGKRSDAVAFTAFDATLVDQAGHKAAHVHIEGSHDSFATAGKHEDFALSAKSIRIDGDSKQASALFAGVRAHLSTLPPPIAASFKLIEKYTGEVAATGTITATNVAVASKGGEVTGHASVDGTVKVPEGTLTAKLLNSRSDGDQLAFDALDVSLKDKHGAIAASLHATGAKADAKAKSAKLDDIHVVGDAAKLREVLDPAIQKMMPAQIGRVLAMLDDSSLTVAAGGVSIEQGANGTHAEVRTITASGTIEVNDASGNTYTARNAQLELDGAQVVLGSDNKPRELDATAMSVRGNWTSSGAGSALKGDATVRTGRAHIVLDANGSPVNVQVGGIHATGDATRTQTGAAPAAPSAKPTKGQQLASLDTETQTAETVAESLRSADVRATLPLFAGRYGRGLEHVNVPAGAQITIAVEVRNNALTNETGVHIAPPLDVTAGSVKGVDLEAKGRDGIIEAQMGGITGFFARLFGVTNLNSYAVGKGPLSLDLPALVRQVTDHMRQAIVQAKDAPADPAKAQRDAQKDSQWLNKERASWQKDHDKHVRQGASQRTLSKDAEDQPRSANIADFATTGIDLGRSSASADVVLARTKDGMVSGHLHGAANGAGRMQLTADALSANLDGNQVSARGVDTGAVNVATTPTSTSVQLSGLRIDELDWRK